MQQTIFAQLKAAADRVADNVASALRIPPAVHFVGAMVIIGSSTQAMPALTVSFWPARAE